MIKRIEAYEIIMHHKMVSNNQRNAYNNNRKNLRSGELLIEADYKQKIIIGLSPRQPSKEYYEQELRSCLGKYTFLSISKYSIY
jgi:hypothetical protein